VRLDVLRLGRHAHLADGEPTRRLQSAPSDFEPPLFSLPPRPLPDPDFVTRISARFPNALHFLFSSPTPLGVWALFQPEERSKLLMFLAAEGDSDYAGVPTSTAPPSSAWPPCRRGKTSCCSSPSRKTA
jgi:hypothetical protein